MSGLKDKIVAKLGDHPNASQNDNVNPDKGIGKGMNQGEAPGKSWVENKIESGQGGYSREGLRAGSTTSDDTTSAGSASGAIGEKPRGTG